MLRPPPTPPLFPSPPLFRSEAPQPLALICRLEYNRRFHFLDQRCRDAAMFAPRIDGNQPGNGQTSAGCVLRSEEHTSELQSPCNLVCRLLLEKKKIITAQRLCQHCYVILSDCLPSLQFAGCLLQNIYVGSIVGSITASSIT